MLISLQYFQEKSLVHGKPSTCEGYEEETKIGIIKSSYCKRCLKHYDVSLSTSALILHLEILNRKILFFHYKVKLHQLPVGMLIYLKPLRLSIVIFHDDLLQIKLWCSSSSTLKHKILLNRKKILQLKWPYENLHDNLSEFGNLCSKYPTYRKCSNIISALTHTNMVNGNSLHLNMIPKHSTNFTVANKVPNKRNY